MISRKTLRIAGAAVLGTLVGTGSAHAQVYLDSNGMTMGQVKVALESLTDSAMHDGETYHLIQPYGDIFDVYHVVGRNSVAVTDTLYFDYTLENMVFQTPIMASSLVLTEMDRATAAGGTLDTAVVAGGAAGDDNVSFSVTPGTAIALDASDSPLLASLAIGTVGVQLSATGAVGNVKMQARRYIAGRDYPETETTLALLDVDPVLQETSDATSATASVSHGYVRFDDGSEEGSTKTSIGTLLLNVKTADGIQSVIGTSGFNNPSLATGEGGDITQPSESRVTFAGEVRFVKDVFVSESNTCAQLGTPVSLVEDTDPGEAVNMEWRTGDKRALVNAFRAKVDGEAHHICIEVDGETEIPFVEKYTAIAVYAGLEDAAHAPVGMSQDLGGITRDGTTVYLSDLDVRDTYNQRIVIWNRGSRAATYTLAFPEGATAGTDATGSLAAGEVKNLSLRNDEVVTLSEGTRTAATLTVNADPSQIEVSTIRYNRTNQSTDTVYYGEADRQ